MQPVLFGNLQASLAVSYAGSCCAERSVGAPGGSRGQGSLWLGHQLAATASSGGGTAGAGRAAGEEQKAYFNKKCIPIAWYICLLLYVYEFCATCMLQVSYEDSTHDGSHLQDAVVAVYV